MTDLVINPHDGFRATILEQAESHVIAIEVRGAGEALAAVEVASFTHTDYREAEAKRMFYWVEATCRFLNQGGDIRDLGEALSVIHATFGEKFTVQFPDDWELLAVLQDVPDPTFVLQCQATERAIVVKEDQYSEHMSLHELEDQIDHVEKDSEV